MIRRSFATLLVVGAGALAACTPASTGEGFVEVPGLGATRIDVPRPSSGVSGPCDADPLPEPSDASVEDRVAALRDIGFFADRADRSDAELAAEVEADLAGLWGDSLAPDDPILDLAIAETDRSRVWWRDLEADVVEENQVYTETVAAWGDISVGTFAPEGIEEAWDGPTGPVHIRFSHAGADVELRPAYLEDWIDPMIVIGVNETIAASDRRFHIYKAFDQTAYVLALTDDELRALEARGWCFE